VTIGDDEPSYNRIWYRIGEEGYAHSGTIQPVRTVLNSPDANIPKGGTLAEVTVPFTDAYWAPGKENEVAYRYYYETTYWVVGLVQDSRGNPWYRILEDKWEFLFYAPAAHLRLIPAAELSPLSPTIPPMGKRLEIRTAEQVLVAFEWDRPIFMARVATGAKFSDGNYSTQPGRHITFYKRPSRHMARGNLAANGYDLPGVPWISYITEDGVSLHGTFWHNDFGKPRSHGCINLTPKAAKWVYRWTIPYVPPFEQKVYETYGTTVDVI
jgi:lipoprotein-anchoring transpeptidase ErfK/SrfK